MSSKPTRFARGAAAITVSLALSSCQGAVPRPPETRRDDTVETMHGVDVRDPYRWLENDDSDDTRAWIARQQAYTRDVLDEAPSAGVLRGRLRELYRVDTVSAPMARGNRYFFARRRPDQDLAVLYVRRSPTGSDEVLVDPQGIGADLPVSVDYLAVSPDGSLAAYSLRRGGEDETEVRFVDVDAGEDLADILPRGRYFNVSIMSDGSGVFYDRLTPDGPRVFEHAFGAEPDTDRVVFGAGYDAAAIIASRLSSNGRYLLITVDHGAAATRTEMYFRDTWTGTQVHTIVNDIEAAFEGHVAGDILFVLTNWGAPNGRVFAANLRRPSPDSWTEIVQEGETPIENILPVGGRLLVQRLEHAQPRLTVHEPDGFPVRDVPLPGAGALTGIGGGSWESDEVFYTFSSLARPPTVSRYRVSDGNQSVWAQTEAPVDTSDYEIEQVAFPSADGTSIPMFVSHRRGIQIDGAHAALLTGYGGFRVSMQPAFDPFAIAWMEAGGVWALPALRGGGELGEGWHRAGMLANKQNVFDDFIAAAEWLIANRYTEADRLAIRGGSNGGLLVGAALTQRPDLFAAVVCRYPLLDMLRYDRFLVAGYWVPEYGSAQDPEQFRYLADYSPYHQVRRGARYPSVMLVSGDGDTRVAPLHARKMTARLQADTGSANPVVLLYDSQSGHSGGRPIGATIDELTAELRFLLWRTRGP